jgi:hypothetical protein
VGTWLRIDLTIATDWVPLCRKRHSIQTTLGRIAQHVALQADAHRRRTREQSAGRAGVSDLDGPTRLAIPWRRASSQARLHFGFALRDFAIGVGCP